MTEELFSIEDRLRNHFHTLEKLLGVSLSANELERVFQEALADQVSPKSYCFYESASTQITGIVNEYEPESIWIQIHGNRKLEQAFKRYINDARLLKPNGEL